MYWEIDLSNGETVREDGNDICHWGKMVSRCQEQNLKIVEFRLVNKGGLKSKVIDKNADRYFVINDVIGLVGKSGKKTYSRRGIGSVRESVGKTRVEWFRWPGRQFITVEVTQKLDACLPEISVERLKS